VPEISKLQRWLDLIAYLIGRRYPVDVGAIMESVPPYARALEEGTAEPSVRRTFERDKDELRELGIPIETVEAGDGTAGYRLSRRDFYLPYLRLLGTEGRPATRETDVLEFRQDEARDARDALRLVGDMPGFPLQRQARSALRKLRFDLPDFASTERPAPVLFADRPEAEDVRATVDLLHQALQERKRVRFRYHGIYRGEATDRDVAAYGLMFRGGHWYLIGHDNLRDAVRVFRVARMEKPSINTARPGTPDYEVPGDFDLSTFRGREAWELGGGDEAPLRALVSFRFPTSLWVDRNGYGEPVEDDAEGGVVRAFLVHQVNPFLRWILSLAGEARVLEPPELRKEFDHFAAETATLYRRAT
jgi:proteasome accessory factor B